MKPESLQCSWVKRFYDDLSHEWKVMPLKLIEQSFESHFKFYSNFLFNIFCSNDFPFLPRHLLKLEKIFSNQSRNSIMHPVVISVV